MMRLGLGLAALLLSGCYDFKKDLFACFDAGGCTSPGGGGGGDGTPLPVTQVFCSADRWCSDTPLPRNRLNGVAALAADDVWAFGERGLVEHFDGTAWNLIDGATLDLGRAQAFGPSEMLVASSSGLYRFDRAAWTALTPAQDVSAFSAATPRDVWYAINGGLGLFHLLGAAPAASVTSPCDRVTALLARDAEVWAGCDDGRLFSWNGTAFVADPHPPGRGVGAFWSAGPDDVWMGGDFGLWHRSGGAWAPMTVDTSGPVVSLSGSAANDVWAVALNGTVAHWDGQQFGLSSFDALGYAQQVAADGPGQAWAVTTAGRVVHREGTSWTPAKAGNTTPLSSCAALAANDVWAVGNAGRLTHFDGTGWREASLGSPKNVTALAALPGGELWLAGTEGLLLRWKNSVSTTVAVGTRNFTGIAAVSVDAAIASGEDGTLLQVTAAGTVTPVDTHVTTRLNAVAAVSASEFYAVGAQGTFLRCVGQPAVCTTVSTSETRDFTSVYARKPNDVFAVGRAGLAMHFDGTSLQPIDRVPAANWTSVRGDGSPSGAVLVAGEGGYLMRGDENGLSAEQSRTGVTPWGVCVAGRTSVAVGDFGLILRQVLP